MISMKHRIKKDKSSVLFDSNKELIVEVRAIGSKWKAFDQYENDATSWIGTGQRQKAFNSKMALKRLFYKDGRPYWRIVTLSEYNHAKSPGEITMQFASPKKPTSATSNTDNTESTNGEYNPFGTHNEIVSFIKESYKLKPKVVFIDELRWKHIIRTVIRGKNMMLTGMQGSGKTLVARTVGKVLNRPFFVFPLGETQDPRSFLLGNTHFDKSTGTVFYPSRFIRAIQTPGAVILLDEISRAHPEASNILMPVLDYTQRYVVLDESRDNEIVRVAEGVSFIATANIGNEFTSTRVMDRAMIDRFDIIEVPQLSAEDEFLLLKLLYPQVDEEILRSIAEIAFATRANWKSDAPKLSTAMSTRKSVETAGLIYDGFSLADAAITTIYPFFSDDGGIESERTFVTQIVQKYVSDGSASTLFTPDDINQAKTS